MYKVFYNKKNGRNTTISCSWDNYSEWGLHISEDVDGHIYKWQLNLGKLHIYSEKPRNPTENG